MDFAKKSFFGLVFLILIFLGTEAGLVLLRSPSLQYYRDLKLIHSFHPDYYVALEPGQSKYVSHFAGKWEGQFSINSLGLRGKEEPIPGKPKLLCLGDSLVMGFGVGDSDTFCQLLDGIQLKGEARQALNLGVDAYGSRGSYFRLKDISSKLDNVKEVLFFISPNDFDMPEALAKKGILPDDQTDAIREKDPNYARNFKLQFILTRISYTLQSLKLAYEQIQVTFAVTKLSVCKELDSVGLYRCRRLDGDEVSAEPKKPSGNLVSYFESSFFRTVKRPNCDTDITPTSAVFGAMCPETVPSHVSCVDSAPSFETLPALPELTQEYYQKMIDLAKERGFKLVPVILPIQIEEIYCYNNGKYHPLENYATRASTFFEKRGVKVLRFKKETASMCGFDQNGKKFGILDHYIPEDGHFTKRGNIWAADSLKTKLKETDLAL
ncbi:LA_2490 family SGNH/GDSL-type esterase [Leptospira neocaledonica]|uniref:Lipase n=1 Tax=Leptospira neocaledonica TaxID=2023192 RepID=A0A2M9ZVZ5_9LEPT|nr:lipase [Leptospira neocaledonica]PJZ76143.1 lipase [Leptospira neocaledonica]